MRNVDPIFINPSLFQKGVCLGDSTLLEGNTPPIQNLIIPKTGGRHDYLLALVPVVAGFFWGVCFAFHVAFQDPGVPLPLAASAVGGFELQPPQRPTAVLEELEDFGIPGPPAQPPGAVGTCSWGGRAPGAPFFFFVPVEGADVVLSPSFLGRCVCSVVSRVLCSLKRGREGGNGDVFSLKG